MHRRSLLLVAAAIPLVRGAHACEVRTAAEVKLRDVAGFLIVPASVGGVPVSLLLDTGAETGLVTPAAARLLGFPADRGRQTLVEGTGGSGGVIPHAMLAGLAIGGLALPALSVPVAPLPAVPRIVPPVVGLLGADVLSGFDVELDVPRGRLALHRVPDDCAAPAPWPHDIVTLRRSGDRLIAPAILDGRRLDALLDTGALSVVLDTGAAAGIGVSAAALARDPGGISGGVDMREVAFHWHRFASLAVGGVVVRNPVITVMPVSEQTPLLLGASWFAGRHVWLSYAAGRMFVAR